MISRVFETLRHTNRLTYLMRCQKRFDLGLGTQRTSLTLDQSPTGSCLTLGGGPSSFVTSFFSSGSSTTCFDRRDDRLFLSEDSSLPSAPSCLTVREDRFFLKNNNLSFITR